MKNREVKATKIVIMASIKALYVYFFEIFIFIIHNMLLILIKVSTAI